MRVIPVMPQMCKTCPWQPRSPYKYLTADLAASALNEASRICHSTGGNNAINRRTGKPERLCRGARNVQLQYFAAIKFIEAPTDEAWEKKCMETGIENSA